MVKKRLKSILFKNKKLYNLIFNYKSCGGGYLLVDKGKTRILKDIKGVNNYVSIGVDSILNDVSIRIRGNNNKLIFGDKCVIGEECSFWIEGNNVSINIGNLCTFTQKVHFCAQEDFTSIVVGDDCMFSNDIIVRTSDSHPIYDMNSGKRINPPCNVVIGNHVWIAPTSKIMKGARIGNNSIIGSNTMVNGFVPNNSLAVGYPSKVVKENIKWTRETLF